MEAPALEVLLHELDEPRGRLEVREALRQVHGAMLLGERRHHREDRRADRRELALERLHRACGAGRCERAAR